MRKILEIDLLRSFLMVCKVGNISHAAEKLFISQPALTRKIQALEEALDCQLIERGKRGISLTENGYLLQMRAREIVDLAEDLVSELADTGSFLSGNVKVGCVESKAMQEMANLIADFKHQYPHVNVDLNVGDGDALRTALDNHLLDMVVLLEPVEAAKYQTLPLSIKDRWVAAFKKKEGWQAKREITPQELVEMPLILPRRQIVREELCQLFGIDPGKLKIGAFHNLPSAGIALVKAGLGTLLCVEGSFDGRGGMDISILPVKLPYEVRHVLARKKNKPLSKAAETFWSACERLKEGTKHSNLKVNFNKSAEFNSKLEK